MRFFENIAQKLSIVLPCFTVLGALCYLSLEVSAQIPDGHDEDHDGLITRFELEINTNPFDADTDNDGLKDGEEIVDLVYDLNANVTDYTMYSDPNLIDSDYDGLTDYEEFQIGSDPNSSDSDGDSLTDKQEADIGSSPISFDTDGDGYDDKSEVDRGTDPTIQDHYDEDETGLIQRGRRSSAYLAQFTLGNSPDDAYRKSISYTEQGSKIRTDWLTADNFPPDSGPGWKKIYDTYDWEWEYHEIPEDDDSESGDLSKLETFNFDVYLESYIASVNGNLEFIELSDEGTNWGTGESNGFHFDIGAITNSLGGQPDDEFSQSLNSVTDQWELRGNFDGRVFLLKRTLTVSKINDDGSQTDFPDTVYYEVLSESKRLSEEIILPCRKFETHSILPEVTEIKFSIARADMPYETASDFVPSLPAPEVGVDMQISNPRIVDGVAVVDLGLTGIISSELADTINGDLGIIDEGYITINGEDDLYPLEILPSKESVAQNVASYDASTGELLPYSIGRYPYSGSVAQVLFGVELVDGVNTIDVAAVDKSSGAIGKKSFEINVDLNIEETTPPALASLSLDMPALNIESGEGDVVDILYSADGNEENGLIFAQDELDPLKYASEAGDVLFVDEDENGFYECVCINVEEISATEIQVDLPNESEVKSFSSVITPSAEAPQSVTIQLTVTQPEATYSTTTGDFVPYVLTTNIGDYLEEDEWSSIGLGLGIESSSDLSLYKEDQFEGIDFSTVFVEDPNAPGSPLILTPIYDYETSAGGRITDAVVEATFGNENGITSSAKFHAGVLAGLLKGGVDLVVGTSEIIGTAVGIVVSDAMERQLSFAIEVNEIIPGVGPNRYLGDLHSFFQMNVNVAHADAIQIVRSLDAAREYVAENQTALAIMALGYALDSNDLYLAGEHAFSETNQTVLFIAAEVIEAAIEVSVNASDFDKGEFIGRVMFEILAMVVPASKLSALSKADVLTALKGNVKVKSTQSAFAAAVWAKVAPFIEGIVTTKMCFVAGTLVHTQEGLVPIENIQVGDYVLSRSEDGSRKSFKRVLDTFETNPDTLLHITVSGKSDNSTTETITTTEAHPFYAFSGNCDKGEFLEAKDITVSHKLIDSYNEEKTIISIFRERAPPEMLFTTYNFEVEDFHTYFVGESGVWVHNFSARFCETFFTVAERAKEKLEITDPKGRRFEILEESLDSIVLSGHKIDSQTGNHFMHVTQYEEFADYTGDLSSIATVKELKALKTRNSAGGFNHAGGFEIHHTAEKWMSDRLGIPESVWDDAPGIPLRKKSNAEYDATYLEKFGHDPVYHGGTLEQGSLVQRLRQIRDRFDNDPNPNPTTMLEEVRDLYKSPDYRDTNMWEVTRDWLKQNVADPSIVPN